MPESQRCVHITSLPYDTVIPNKQGGAPLFSCRQANLIEMYSLRFVCLMHENRRCSKNRGGGGMQFNVLTKYSRQLKQSLECYSLGIPSDLLCSMLYFSACIYQSCLKCINYFLFFVADYLQMKLRYSKSVIAFNTTHQRCFGI